MPRILLLLLPVFLLGCTTKWVEDPNNVLGKQVLLRSAPPATVQELFPLTEHWGTYKITEGVDAGDNFAFSLVPVNDTWRFTYADRQTTYFRASAAGDLLITREDDLDDDVSVTCDPAIVALPAGLAVGRPYEAATRLCVRTLSTGQFRTQGTCQYQVELLGKQRLKTPAGKFTAHIVKMTRQIMLPIAQVHVEILTAYAPGEGQVAERVVQRTKAMGLLTIDEVTETRLVKSEKCSALNKKR